MYIYNIHVYIYILSISIYIYIYFCYISFLQIFYGLRAIVRPKYDQVSNVLLLNLYVIAFTYSHRLLQSTAKQQESYLVHQA